MASSDKEIMDLIKSIIKKGNSIEIKKENGNIVVIEINRKFKIKRPL